MTHTITLREHESRTFQHGDLPLSAIRHLNTHHKKHVTITQRPFQQAWKITAAHHIGHIPLPDNTRLIIQPKIPLTNLFEMLTAVWNLDPITPNGITQSDTLADFHSRLAQLLANGILKRGKRGLYKAYLPRTERLPYVRGRINPRHINPTTPTVLCDYQEQTADLPHNQLILWTLDRIIRTRTTSDPAVIKAYRALRSHITLTLFNAQFNLSYTRLNEDYRPLHAICRFFLTHISPTHRDGTADTLPILINMWQLFERFVAHWLTINLTTHTVHTHLRQSLGDHITYDIDIVIKDETGQTVCVIDTKYKQDKTPSTADFNQAINYALAQNTPRAYLIYPSSNITPFTQSNGNVTVQTLPFDLTQPFTQSDNLLLQTLQTLQTSAPSASLW